MSASSHLSSADAAWVTTLERVLAEPQRISVLYQPIVDLRRGSVRGYEALARFPEAPEVPTIDWFDAAARLGYEGRFEAQVIGAALAARPLLLRRRFISVNVSPRALISGEVRRAFGREQLDSIIIEITERDSDGLDPLILREAADALRAAGAGLAIDDAGAGYGSVERVMGLRPQFVKIDAAVVGGVEIDPARVAMVEALGALAARLDARLIAEGIENDEQLDALVGLGVPLGQGYALGRPGAALGEIDAALATRIRERTPPALPLSGIAGYAEMAPMVGSVPALRDAFAAQPSLEHVVVSGPDERPAGVLDRAAAARGTEPRQPLCLLGSTTATDATRRAMARPLETRFDPVVCVDERGTYSGLVPIDRLVGALAG